MELQIGVYKVLGIELGMVSINGKFWCTGGQLAKLFGSSSADTINRVYRRNSRRFSGTRLMELLSRTNCPANELRSALGAKRLRKDAVVYNSRDVLSMGLILNGDEAAAFQSDVLDMIEAQATFNMVPKEQLEAALMTNKQLTDMKEALEEKLDQVSSEMLEVRQHLGLAASNAGRTLRLVRETK
jgi:hypothetical protein